MNAGPIQSDESQVDLAYNRANEKAIVLVLAGLLFGSMAVLAWEWVAWRFDLVATVPRSRQQRFLISSHLGLWFTLCGLMIAWLFSTRRYDRLALRLPEHLGVYVGPGTWWLGMIAFFCTLRGPALIIPAVFATILFIGFQSRIRLLSRLSRDGLMPLI